jgi:hypothetical protein
VDLQRTAPEGLVSEGIEAEGAAAMLDHFKSMEFSAVVVVLKLIISLVVVSGNIADGTWQYCCHAEDHDQHKKKGEYAVHASSTHVRSMRRLGGYSWARDFTK